MFEMTVTQRDHLVEQYLWCIDSVIQNYKELVNKAHLDWEDVYQSLALRLIQVVGRYHLSRKRNLEEYIFVQLERELRVCIGPRARYGFRKAPYQVSDVVVSMDSLIEAELRRENQMMMLADV